MINNFRLDLLKKILLNHDLDGVFIFSTKNDARYAVWLYGRQPLMYHYFFLSKTGEVRILDIHYLAESIGPELQQYVYNIDEENLFDEGINTFASERGLRKVGLAGLAPYSHFASSGLEILNIQNEIDKYLAHKTENEIDELSVAAHNLARTINNIKFEDLVGKTEVEVARYVKNEALKWAEQESFPTSIVSGERLKSATAGLSGTTKITKDCYVAIDNGFFNGKVHTDMTRMFFSDNDPRKQNYEKLVDIHNRVIESARAGVTLQELCDMYDREFESVFGLGKYLFETKDLGHSIGFGLHEYPIFVQDTNSDYKIIDGIVFTLEPEILFEGWRYRIEDMVVCKNGKFEILTR